jgi:hypothetical protein
MKPETDYRVLVQENGQDLWVVKPIERRLAKFKDERRYHPRENPSRFSEGARG